MTPGYSTKCSLGNDVRSFSKTRLLCRFQITYLSGLKISKDCETPITTVASNCTSEVCYGPFFHPYTCKREGSPPPALEPWWQMLAARPTTMLFSQVSESYEVTVSLTDFQCFLTVTQIYTCYFSSSF
jgi:hypothetical protein